MMKIGIHMHAKFYELPVAERPEMFAVGGKETMLGMKKDDCS
jgi:hypothetical protein